MFVPDYVWDELRVRTTGDSGLLIALAIFRHGGGRNAEAYPREGIEHRARVRATLTQLKAMAGVSIRSCGDAVKELKELGMLEESKPQVRNGPRSFSMPYALPPSAEFAASAESGEPAPANFADEVRASRAEHANSAGAPDSSRGRANGGGGEVFFSSDDLVQSGRIPTTTNIPREQILLVLRALRVSSIPGILKEYGLPNVYGALKALHDEVGRRSVNNPAGFLVGTLREWREFDVPHDASFLGELAALEQTAKADAVADHAKWKRSPFSRLEL